MLRISLKPSFFEYLICTCLGLGLMIFFISACWQKAPRKIDPKQEAWVDSVFNTLNETEKIGQLFSVRAHSNLGASHQKEVEQLIRTYKVGGLIFFQGTPHKQAQLTNHYQSLARIPLMVSIDGEWGLAMRLDSTMHFPYQMTLGAVQEDTLIYAMGKVIGQQCRRIGLHVNFAPVVDVNSNPKNPVINYRAFSENKELVAKYGIAYMKGLQSQKIIASAKHFPGHGDTDKDSHYTLPTIQKSKAQLEDMEFYPFKKLIANDLQSIMVAHLRIPALDNAPYASTLSKPIVTGLLQEQMDFEGLIFTDALEMKGVSAYYTAGEVSVLALLAGNDVLLLPADVPQAFAAIQNALKTGRLSWEMIDHKVRKILRAKYFAGLNQYEAAKLNNLYEDLHSKEAQQLRTQLYQKAITVAINQDSLLPFQYLDTLRFASVALNVSAKNPFQKMLDNYAEFEHFQIAKGAYPYQYTQLTNQLSSKNVVVIGLHTLSTQAKLGYGITWQVKDFIKKLSQKTNVVLVVFGSPYTLAEFDELPQLVCAYEDNSTTQKLVPQLLFGACAAEGKLPITASTRLPFQTGITYRGELRLGFALPEDVGMHSDSLKNIDRIVENSIKEEVMPGAQVLIARKGKIVWQKAYGKQTYNQEAREIDLQTIYDVASITKVAATLPSIMYLYNEGKIDLDQKASYYLPEMVGTNKEHITLREILTHQAGLVAYIPFWKETFDEAQNKPLSKYYRKEKTDEFSNEVSRNLFGWKGIEPMLWEKTLASEMNRKRKPRKGYEYVYSDLSFYILKQIAERLLDEPIEEFTQRQFYKALGMQHTTFTPLQYFPPGQICPTEEDDYFRMETVHGTVHDQGAAMLGGVGGHAGLFSTALDLAKYLQVHLQGGQYGGRQFFRPEVVQLFTQPQFAGNRRGLGWDRKDHNESYSYIADFASEVSFGHSGFTGCAVWADPKEELLMVFLSNRIYPTAQNEKLIQQHIRRKVFNQAYLALDYKHL